jgi:hypothetical protein
MAIMAHGGVATARPMRVVMFGVGDARHGRQPFIRQGLPLQGASVPTSCAAPAAIPSERPAM